MEAGNAKKELAERYLIRKRFWTALLERAKAKTKLHAGISPGQYNWIGTSAGTQGLNFNYSVRQHDGQVELYIDVDKESGAGNTAIFEKLLAHKEQIEQEFGDSLEWEALEGKRACRIKKTVAGGGWQDEEKWPGVHEAMIDAMIRLEKALRPHLKRL